MTRKVDGIEFCEICGSTNIMVANDNEAVCDNCGTRTKRKWQIIIYVYVARQIN